MMRSSWWKHDSFEAHVDQHRSAAGREFVVGPPGGITADSVQFHTVVPHDALMLRRAYLVNDSDIDANASNYWTIDIVQRHYDGRYTTLLSFDNSARGFTGFEQQRLPAEGNIDVPLKGELPILVICKQTGAPDALDSLKVFLVMAQR
jgi:hypothetical protein